MSQYSAKNRRYYEANKERLKAAKRERYQTNKESIAAANYKYKQANKERLRAAGRKDWLINKERKKAVVREWRRNNRDTINALERTRRALKRNAIGRYTAADIQLMRALQNNCCAAPHCRKPFAGRGTVDHIIPLARGGSNWPDNLQLLCGSCNSKKGIRTMDEWLAQHKQERA